MGEQAVMGPTVHMEFIQTQAGLPEGERAEQVEAYHRAVFLHHHACDLERYQQEARIHEERLDHLDERLKDTSKKLAGIDPLMAVTVDGVADVQPTAPWNRWDRAMFVAALAGILALLCFGVLNISFNLLESGLVTFMESPVRAYFWAALLPAGALAVKVGWDFLQGPRARRIYLWSCLVAGVAGVLVWVAAYSAVYPTLSTTTSEQIESMSVFDRAGNGPAPEESGLKAKRIDATIVGAQAVAEIFLSAVLGIYMTLIYGRHRPVKLAANPLFTQVDEDRRRLEADVAQERLALAQARGNAAKLENQLAALLAFARSMFERESELRRDQSHQKRKLLEQISEQLRTQLESVENGNGSGNGRGGEKMMAGALMDRDAHAPGRNEA